MKKETGIKTITRNCASRLGEKWENKRHFESDVEVTLQYMVTGLIEAQKHRKHGV